MTAQTSLKWNQDCVGLYRNNLLWFLLVGQNFDSTPLNGLYSTLERAIYQAAHDTWMIRLTSSTPKQHGTRWFDEYCKIIKRLVTHYLQHCKKEDTNSLLWEYYYATKNQYYALIRSKKSEYQKILPRRFASPGNPSEFWRVMKSVMPSNNRTSNIKPNTWLNFFKNIYPSRNVAPTYFNIPFSINALTRVISST